MTMQEHTIKCCTWNYFQSDETFRKFYRAEKAGFEKACASLPTDKFTLLRLHGRVWWQETNKFSPSAFGAIVRARTIKSCVFIARFHVYFCPMVETHSAARCLNIRQSNASKATWALSRLSKCFTNPSTARSILARVSLRLDLRSLLRSLLGFSSSRGNGRAAFFPRIFHLHRILPRFHCRLTCTWLRRRNNSYNFFLLALLTKNYI